MRWRSHRATFGLDTASVLTLAYMATLPSLVAYLFYNRGVELIGPEAGELAEGEIGLGRMTEPEAIAARVEEILGSTGGTLAGRHVLVSAGGTREPLDAVRFLGNRSSGRMGVALARGESTDEAVARARAAASRVRIRYGA